jgi:hypothetical protein
MLADRRAAIGISAGYVLSHQQFRHRHPQLPLAFDAAVRTACGKTGFKPGLRPIEH